MSSVHETMPDAGSVIESALDVNDSEEQRIQISLSVNRHGDLTLIRNCMTADQCEQGIKALKKAIVMLRDNMIGADE